MPLQNRVTPAGGLVAHPARGDFLGNRGMLLDADRRLARRWSTQAWIVCRLEWKGARRAVWTPGTWTELFFLDEATALAAGHRPCHHCRREAALAFADAWRRGNPGEWDRGVGWSVRQLDRVLHRERRGARWRAAVRDLPDGALVDVEGTAMLVQGGTLRPWSFEGYGQAISMPAADVEVLTPRTTVGALGAGYRPVLHRSAGETSVLRRDPTRV